MPPVPVACQPRAQGNVNMHDKSSPNTLLVLLFSWRVPSVSAQQEVRRPPLQSTRPKSKTPSVRSLYGQFAEFMFEDIKGGLYAELIRDRGFNEAPNALGLSRYWERDPDDRDDDDALHFTWDDSVYAPVRGDANTLSTQHSVRVDIDHDRRPTTRHSPGMDPHPQRT